MALIECPTCGKQISDKAVSCPGCSTVLKAQEQPKYILCAECGSEISHGVSICPSCGYPVNVNSETIESQPQKVEVTNIKLPKMGKKSKITITMCIVTTVVIIAGIFIGVTIKKNKENSDYLNNLKAVSSTMLLGATTAEGAGGLIHDVWYNTIYEKSDLKTDKYTQERYSSSYNDDFNDSLAALFEDSTFKDKINSIKSNQELVDSYMNKLNKPPQQYEDAYDALKKYYDAYLDLTNIVINPSGNLQSYTNNFNEADSAVVKCYKAMSIYTELP